MSVENVVPLYLQQDNERWAAAAALYYDEAPQPQRVRRDTSRSECQSPSPVQYPPVPLQFAHRLSLPSIQRSRMRSEAIACARCGNSPTAAGSIPFSLNKVSSLNRSLAGASRESLGGSRGESSLELEAVAAMHELSFAVQSICVSEMLPRTPDLIFVNVTTIEGQPYCLELTLKGWRVTSLRSDCMVGDFTRLDMFTKYYDSLYSLMDDISPGYRSRFGEKLAQKLRLLENGDDIEVAPSSSYSSPPFSPSPTHASNESLPVITPSSSPVDTSFDRPIYA